jgi:acetyltransferase-like isoleucine patch superfamily enzyme
VVSLLSLNGIVGRLGGALLALPVRLRERIGIARLRSRCVAAKNVTFTRETIIHNPFGTENVQVGANTLFMGEINVIASDARVSIGDWCFVGPAAKIWALDRITIGNRVFISHGVQIFDNNSHSLSAAERHARFYELQTIGRHLQPETISHKPILIEDDVWIGFNCAIMKGVVVGKGAIVGAASVVTHDVAPYAIVVGNPARKVGESRP